jgi:deazaflavin-dependent oxidoreductase (nitroreductase family)
VPFSRRIAELNRDVTNKVIGKLAGRVPPFAMLEHTGRRSRKHYRTPVMLFRQPDGYAIALTYGPNTDWVKNVLAAGGCTVLLRGREIRLTAPDLQHGPEEIRRFPPPIRVFLSLLNVQDVLTLRPAS